MTSRRTRRDGRRPCWPSIPVQINEFRIEEGELAYRESATSKPLHLSAITFKAGNIRNVRSKADEYPSPVHLEAVVFEQGRLTLDGHADFLAQPSTTINADITLNDIALKNVLPLTAQHQVQLSQGCSPHRAMWSIRRPSKKSGSKRSRYAM